MITTAVTAGVKVTVKTEYQPSYSSPYQEHFVFTYRIRIENNSENTVQLLRRQWFIFDTNGTVKEVEGEGVIGQQPILESGEVHEYISGCHLKTSIGKMMGSYLMEKIVDGRQFHVEIPEFNLIAPFRLN